MPRDKILYGEFSEKMGVKVKIFDFGPFCQLCFRYCRTSFFMRFFFLEMEIEFFEYVLKLNIVTSTPDFLKNSQCSINFVF